MADISIKQEHQLTLQESKDAAQKVADKMAAEFDMTTRWEGDTLSFKRSGVAGLHANLSIKPRQPAEVSWLALVMRPEPSPTGGCARRPPLP